MDEQLVALASVHELLDLHGIDYWLFGGWAVDFYVGSVTRPHDDVDIAVWLSDHARIAELLAADGWRHAPHDDENGGTGYERDGVRLELTFLVAGADGMVSVPLRSGAVPWTRDGFGTDVAVLDGVRARVIRRDVLADGKSRSREDAEDAAKDAADFAALSQP
jgi:aminoglycoside-2''-adenylyltransferase